MNSVHPTIEEPARTGRTVLRDGRHLAWAEWGPTAGTPAVFCPGAGWGRWLGFGYHVLTELEIRLISVERPGLGDSTSAPRRTLLDATNPPTP